MTKISKRAAAHGAKKKEQSKKREVQNSEGRAAAAAAVAVAVAVVVAVAVAFAVAVAVAVRRKGAATVTKKASLCATWEEEIHSHVTQLFPSFVTLWSCSRLNSFLPSDTRAVSGSISRHIEQAHGSAVTIQTWYIKNVFLLSIYIDD